jgi:DNA mismatch repair protein MutL
MSIIKPTIQILPREIIDKIAAGEVVERPASVVKELVENSFDAGATQIDIEVTFGGKKFISVADNGHGMIRDDAILSVEQHATSKIKSIDDIEKITTMGFRGEALAAISSVSRFRLTTCYQGEIVGTEVIIVGGKLQDVREIGRPKGTTVEVRDLFFNMPARKKFLRSPATELERIKTIFITLALSHPGVGMSLKSDGEEIYNSPAGGTFEDRIRDIFGREYFKNLQRVSFTKNEIKIHGYVALPTISRTDREEQYVFVNGRSATANVIVYAIREAYRGILAKDRYPIVFLRIDCPPEEVDVNVHPTKREVRFRRPDEIRDAIIDAIRNALSINVSAGENARAQPLHSFSRKQLTIGSNEELYPRISGKANAQSSAPAVEPAVTSAEPQVGGKPLWTWCRILGQIGGLYVVLETDSGLVLMDPHAAHERVLFEEFMAEIKSGNVQTQSLLFPETITLRPNEAYYVTKHIDLFREMGFSISIFGRDSFLVDALPACISNASVGSILNEIAQSLQQSGSRGAKDIWRQETIARAACRAAVKAHSQLTEKEIEKLVERLSRAEMPYTCPHGRPTVIFFPIEELNKKFQR